MALSRLEDFDPNYRNRLGGDIQSFRVYTNTNEPVGRVIDAWVDDIGNIQQLVVDLNSPPPGNRVMLPISQAQIDRPTKRIYVNDLSQLQPDVTARRQASVTPHPAESAAYVPPVESNPPYRMASLEESAPLEAPRVHLTSEPVRRVELPPIPPDAYNNPPQPIDYTAHPHVPPVDISRETYTQNYTTHPPVPPLDIDRTGHSHTPMPNAYDSEVPARREEPNVVSEEIIPVLEERLIVDSHVRKTGEVIVRKEIETEIVEVPIKREKLIVEQVGSNPKQLAEIDLHEDNLPDRDAIDRAIENQRQTRKRLD